MYSRTADRATSCMEDDERQEDLYLSALAHYVAPLGGRLEVLAIVGDEEIFVRREPA
jgi:hypothetical protein